LKKDSLIIANKKFNSRLIVGTGKYKSMSECAKAIKLSGAEIVTVAVRRVNISDKNKPLLMDYIDPKKITYLPNTAGCFNSKEALRTLRLAREIGGWKLVKLEVLGDKKTLYPNMIETIKSEVPYGKDKKSRIDFFLTPKSSNPDNRNIYIEVKNTTWIKENVALFPDTVTKRGQKHLIELKELIPESKSVLVPCITRKDAEFFTTGDEADPLYGSLFRESSSAGMMTIPCSFVFHKDHVTWNGIKPLK